MQPSRPIPVTEQTAAAMKDAEALLTAALDRVLAIEDPLARAQAIHWLSRMLDSSAVLVERDGQVEEHESFGGTVRRSRAQAYRDALGGGHSFREVGRRCGVTKGAIQQALDFQKRLDG